MGTQPARFSIAQIGNAMWAGGCLVLLCSLMCVGFAAFVWAPSTFSADDFVRRFERDPKAFEERYAGRRVTVYGTLAAVPSRLADPGEPEAFAVFLAGDTSRTHEARKKVAVFFEESHGRKLSQGIRFWAESARPGDHVIATGTLRINPNQDARVDCPLVLRDAELD